jgi:UDP-N-acetylmuramate dehydrogenase
MRDVDAVLESLRGGFNGTLLEGVPLAEYTTFRIGGPASLLAMPAGIEDLTGLLQAVVESGSRFLVLGKGSNVLVSDRGFDGVVAVLGDGMKRITRKGKDEVYVEGGCELNRLVNWAIELGLGGLEDLAGIPGSVGGAVRMNAGAMGTDFGERVKRVAVMRLAEGEVSVKNIERKEMGFAYRHSALDDSDVVFGVRLQLHAKDSQALQSRRREVMAWRRENQPLRQLSAGSVFRNPPGASAAELIDRCGLKGTRVGEAMVSEKHANFIVNLGGASAKDVFSLMMRVKAEVKKVEGVELEEEIRLVGEMGEDTL